LNLFDLALFKIGLAALGTDSSGHGVGDQVVAFPANLEGRGLPFDLSFAMDTSHGFLLVL
jgi:hypothetical protein